MSNKLSHKTNSDLLLNIKDIEQFKSSNVRNKIQDQTIKLEKELEKYNKTIVDALEAPIPNISLHYNEILLRAVPSEIRSKGGIIMGTGNLNNFAVAEKLTKMSHAISFFQEILMVGPMVTDPERNAGIKPGRIARVKLDRYRSLSDDHLPGVIETMYNVPIEVIDGYNYLIMDKRDIMYTKDA